MRTWIFEPMDGAGLKDLLRQRALKLGFDSFGITPADSIPEAPTRLQAFLAKGHHGTMDWMEGRSDQRSSPMRLWPGVRSIIMLAMNYGTSSDALAHLDNPACAGISVYARNRDYHDVVKGKLKELAGLLVAKGGGEAKVFVDTAPVMEKPLAAAAGLGWQGKHTNLVSRGLGSWFFLGAVFTSLELPADESEPDHCGRCRACLDCCPTDAFPAPYQLDARRCISYLTIEHRGLIPLEFRKAMGNRIYGCDDCLAVCPWNKFAKTAKEIKLRARPELNQPPLSDLLRLSDSGFRRLFAGSPIKRIGRDRFVRNVLVAAGNSGARDLIPSIELLLEDSASVVRGTAIWALGELAGVEHCALLCGKRRRAETDPEVLAEFRLIERQAGNGSDGSRNLTAR